MAEPPYLFWGTRVIEISLTALVAGTKYRGEFEERMEAVVREASCGSALRSLGEEWEPKPILFIDEIHLLLGAGSASGSMDATNILGWKSTAFPNSSARRRVMWDMTRAAS
ncbi:MAG: AAA family ATPase [Akkermansiaceae bacterium]